MMIDIAAHILPEKYKDELYKAMGGKFQQAEGTPTITDVESRFRLMDRYNNLVQVLTVCGPPLDGVVSPKDATRLARLANDEVAGLIYKYPDRFVGGVATLSTSDIDAALEELDRAINELRLRGVMLWTPQFSFDPKRKGFPTIGEPLDLPRLDPLYEKMQAYKLPIWIHPATEAAAHYAGESKGKYYAWQVFSWPYETTLAMNRLVFGGVLERYPDLKFITHHCGAMVPYFERRIKLSHDFAEMRLNRKHKKGLRKDPLDYFRMFYSDTAISGSTPGLMCAYAFFGADHLLFGTDMPFDSQTGHVAVRETIRSIEEMDIPHSEKKQIFEGNARSLMRLPV
jgi:predicted TIM-barrel fold metal-dependent hydrolase